MSKKHRAPREQLLEAGEKAKKMLQDKGIIAKKSILDEIAKNKDAPLLPGIPTYLPHRWTIKKSQQIMYDLLLMWKDKCREDEKKDPENITQFFKFLIAELREQEREYNREIERMPTLIKSLKTVPVLRDVFFPVNKKETVHAIQRFFLDSLAVAIVVKSNHSTSEYANWFLDWSQELHALWVNPIMKNNMPKI
jgi:hypothetical protein